MRVVECLDCKCAVYVTTTNHVRHDLDTEYRVNCDKFKAIMTIPDDDQPCPYYKRHDRP
jgi:hypothetical protein